MEGEEAATVDLRESMLETAVKFLQNPKVRQSAFAQRRTFLQNKGLTKEEIDEAILRSGTAADEHATTDAVATVTQAAQPQLPVVVAPPVSTWNTAKDYAASAIVIGGLGYALYQFYRRYLAPIWFGPSKEEKQLLSIEESVRSLQENMAATLKSVQTMQETLSQQQENISRLFTDGMAQRGSGEMQKMQDRQYVTEIKEEIKSLKGLLLNRKQFPPTPKTAPVVPAWQLEASKSSQPPAENAKPAAKDNEVTPDATVSGSLLVEDSGVTASSELISTAPVANEETEVSSEKEFTMSLDPVVDEAHRDQDSTSPHPATQKQDS